jgi:hypothetical protein
MAIYGLSKVDASDVPGAWQLQLLDPIDELTAPEAEILVELGSNATRLLRFVSVAKRPYNPEWGTVGGTLHLYITQRNAEVWMSVRMARVDKFGVLLEQGAYSSEVNCDAFDRLRTAPDFKYSRGLETDRLLLEVHLRNTSSLAQVVAFRVGESLDQSEFSTVLEVNPELPDRFAVEAKTPLVSGMSTSAQARLGVQLAVGFTKHFKMFAER